MEYIFKSHNKYLYIKHCHCPCFMFKNEDCFTIGKNYENQNNNYYYNYTVSVWNKNGNLIKNITNVIINIREKLILQ